MSPSKSPTGVNSTALSPSPAMALRSDTLIFLFIYKKRLYGKSGQQRCREKASPKLCCVFNYEGTQQNSLEKLMQRKLEANGRGRKGLFLVKSCLHKTPTSKSTQVRAMQAGFKGNICDQGKACDLADRGVPGKADCNLSPVI